MLRKKRRVFLKSKKRRAKFTKLDALAALGAVLLITSLSVMAFRNGRGDDLVPPFADSDTVQTAPQTIAPQSITPPAAIATKVQNVGLAKTGSTTMPLIVVGLSMVLLGTAMKVHASRRTSISC